MRSNDPFSEVNLDVGLGSDPHARDARRERGEPYFRLAVLGDLGGRAATRTPPGSGSRCWRVDRDDLDGALADVAPTLRLDLGGGAMADVRIRAMDDFHPDRLVERVPQLASLGELRARLADPATFRRAADELATPAPPPPPAAAPRAVRPSGSLLDAIVGVDEPAAAAHGGAGGSDDLYEFMRRAMAPHLVARADPRQAELLAQMDRTLGAVLRSVLHHPDFQALEALWRGVERLVRHVDTDEQLQVHLVDVTRDELVADLADADSPRESATFRRLAERAPEAEGGWGALVAHFTLGEGDADVPTLGRLARLGQALDAPVIAEAHPNLALGALSDAAQAGWNALRASPQSGYLALALPRVLLRLPYGESSDPIDQFPFDELDGGDAHGSYLWGNPALFCAALLADGFSERGGGLAPGTSLVIDRLPLHMVRRAGEVTARPCAELLMREDDALALIEAGIIPMIAYRDTDTVRVGRIQSVAQPPGRLSGRLAR